MTTRRSRVRSRAGRLILAALLAASTTLTLGSTAGADRTDGDVGTLTPRDVYMTDYPGDPAIEPNTPSASYWNSPDVRVCPTPVPCSSGLTAPAFTTSYIFVTLRNPGPYGSGTDVGTLRAYFTTMGTTAVWPTNWTPLNSAIVTVPSGVTTVMLPWTTSSPGLVSTLYRWVSTDDPMLYEGPNAYQNTQFNNNVAWKNFSVI
ncbi:hypothetical protein [Micromonospora echinofusca]|uniref:Uncharacterized protein n=1 Tax=Micromonospora echinofusca TaxID=47858 RepID=A0ABS3VYZ2_MICEH|nr:hypothetical protein [Micromonospora echinofusca]MBO4209776.1 hypothetical protein [Micromonospora echinofusca]